MKNSFASWHFNFSHFHAGMLKKSSVLTDRKHRGLLCNKGLDIADLKLVLNIFTSKCTYFVLNYQEVQRLKKYKICDAYKPRHLVLTAGFYSCFLGVRVFHV